MGKLGRRMLRRLRGVKEEKPKIDYYKWGYSDGIVGFMSSLNYAVATEQDRNDYARGYADGRMAMILD